MERTRLTLRLPPDLADTAAALAEHQGLTVNAFMVQAVRNWTDYQLKRLAPPASMASVPPPSGRPAVTVSKVGPNQPCPCGSGQKYKRCHGKPAAA